MCIIQYYVQENCFEKKIFEHPRLVVEEDEVRLESGTTIQYLRYSYGGDGVVIIAHNNDQILFINEYSYVPNKKLLQLPMGKIETGETVEQAGNRELQEEAGYRANVLENIGYYYQNHRRSDNKGYVVLASGLEVSSHSPDIEEEDIELRWVQVDEIAGLIKNGSIIDADTLSSLRIAGV